jgi:hypothetical protein
MYIYIYIYNIFWSSLCSIFRPLHRSKTEVCCIMYVERIYTIFNTFKTWVLSHSLHYFQKYLLWGLVNADKGNSFCLKWGLYETHRDFNLVTDYNACCVALNPVSPVSPHDFKLYDISDIKWKSCAAQWPVWRLPPCLTLCINSHFFAEWILRCS